MNAAVDSAVAKKTRLASVRSSTAANRSRYSSSTDARGAASYQVTQPVLFKRQSALAAIILSLRAATPAAVSSMTLYGLSEAFGLASTEFLSALTVLVTVLSIVLLQPSRHTAAELLSPRWKIAAGLLARWAAVLGSLLVIGYATGYVPLYPRQVIFIWAAVTPVLLILVTLALDELARRLVCRPQNCRSVVFVGYNDTSMYLADRFAQHSELCMSVKGFFDDRSQQRLEAPNLELLGPLSELPAFVKQQAIDVIFISLPMRHIRRVHDLLDALSDTTVSLYYLPDVIVTDLIQARSGEILGVPVITIRETPFHGYRAIAKRLMDVSIAATALVLLAPLLLTIIAAIKLTSAGPVMFQQRRYGLDGREIVIYKFRTMTVTEDTGWLAQARRDDVRITPIGRFLRRWSLDEFPQLINVLQGRMSLVGPRPHAVGHNEEYRRLIKGYMVRHKVPPGITGLAQVKGYRGETRALKDMQSRVHYDLEYLRNWSLLLDLKILLMTIPKLFHTDKAY
jgi:putative colanic acid biosysnthesis UDP-glucose lipid carrier transferase